MLRLQLSSAFRLDDEGGNAYLDPPSSRSADLEHGVDEQARVFCPAGSLLGSM